MSKRGLYAVRISGLVDGDHDFSFDLEQAFFSSLEQKVIETGKVSANVVLEKKTGLFALHFTMKGEVEVICDRCLEPFMSRIETRQTIFVKMGENPGEIEDDVIMIHKDDHEIEVGQLMYEYIVLALPYRKVHPDTEEGEAGCNPEMMKKLYAHLRKQDDNEKSDPRWDALKGIIE